MGTIGNSHLSLNIKLEKRDQSVKLRLHPITAIIGENLVGKGHLLRDIYEKIKQSNAELIHVKNSKLEPIRIINENTSISDTDVLLGQKIIEKFQTPLKKKEFSKKEFELLNLNKDLSYEEFNSRFWKIKELFGLFLPLTSGNGNFFQSIGLQFIIEYLKYNSENIPVFFFEEPEIHLHPQGQVHFRKVLRMLSKDTFFVYTTHSPFMISNLPWEAIIKVNSWFEKKVNVIQVNHGLISKKAFIYASPNTEIASALFSRLIFLVEGETEKIFLSVFLRKIQKKEYDPILDFAEIGITLLPVYGNNFFPYIKLFSKKGFNIPFVIVTDNDSLENLYRAIIETNRDSIKTKNKIQMRNYLQKHNCFVMQEDFEKDFLYKNPKLIELVTKKYFSKQWKEIKYKAKSEKEFRYLLLSLMRKNKVTFAYYLALEAKVEEVPASLVKAINRALSLAKKHFPRTVLRL